jgi:Ser/Thr protein kinase RdoA (MazF antagonist)
MCYCNSFEIGEFIETIKTLEGTYMAVVFSAANGNNLDSETITEKQMEEWGKSLASLHDLSKSYKPVSERRKNWLDTIHFIEKVLQKHPQEREASQELSWVTQWLQSLPITNNVYGLIHYDFELDNIFYQEDNGKHFFNVIDFDDAIYHWFALDIVTALDDFLNNDDSHSELMTKSFLSGYRSITALEHEAVDQFPQFRRFANLYKFSKLLWSLDYSEIDETPPWFNGIQIKLVRVKDELRNNFQESWK